MYDAHIVYLSVFLLFSHELVVNNENVISLYNHTINLRLWDGKDKVSSRARTDRPKAFRLPSGAEAATFGRGVSNVFFLLLSKPRIYAERQHQ